MTVCQLRTLLTGLDPSVEVWISTDDESLRPLAHAIVERTIKVGRNLRWRGRRGRTPTCVLQSGRS